MKKYNKPPKSSLQASLKSLFLCLLLSLNWLIFWQPLTEVKAAEELYFYYPTQVTQGELFYLTISLQSQETVDTVQVFLSYDPSSLSYDPQNSFLIQPGLELNDGHNIFNEERSASEASLALIHWQGELLTDEHGTVAQLAFIAKTDAPLSSSVISLAYSANNVAPFVSTLESGKIVEKDSFVMKLEIAAPAIPEPQPEPIPPEVKDTPSGEPNQPAGDGDSGSGQGVVVIDPDASEQGAAAESQNIATTPTVQQTASITVEVESKSPLLDVDGNELFVPSLAPPESQIPDGFRLEKMTLHGLEIPAIHSPEKVLTLYYLKRDNQAAFYSYKAETDRFTAEDIDKYLVRKRQNEQKSFEREQADKRFPKILTILVLSLVIIGSLALLIGLALRQFRR